MVRSATKLTRVIYLKRNYRTYMFARDDSIVNDRRVTTTLSCPEASGQSVITINMFRIRVLEKIKESSSISINTRTIAWDSLTRYISNMSIKVTNNKCFPAQLNFTHHFHDFTKS